MKKISILLCVLLFSFGCSKTQEEKILSKDDYINQSEEKYDQIDEIFNEVNDNNKEQLTKLGRIVDDIILLSGPENLKDKEDKLDEELIELKDKIAKYQSSENIDEEAYDILKVDYEKITTLFDNYSE